MECFMQGCQQYGTKWDVTFRNRIPNESYDLVSLPLYCQQSGHVSVLFAVELICTKVYLT